MNRSTSATLSRGLLAATVIVALLAPAQASASAAPGIGGVQDRKVRIDIDTDLVGWTRQTAWGDTGPGDPPHSDVVGLGIGHMRWGDRGGGTPYGGISIIGLGVGAIISNRFIVGARASVAFDSAMTKPTDDTQMRNSVVGGTLTPYFHVLFLDQHMVRPFVQVRAGFGGGRSTLTLEGPMGMTSKDSGDFIYPTVGVGGGAHIFVIPRVSVDASLGLDARWVHSRTVTEDPGVPQVKTDWDKTAWELTLAAIVGLSIWI